MFIYLNCHSYYSLLEGTSSIEHLVDAASFLGCNALALTDTNSLYGAVAFYRQAKRANIQPIFGTEIQCGNGDRAVLLAKNMKGFGEICRVITDRQLKENFSLTQRLKQCSHDVILLCSDADMFLEIIQERGTKDLAVELVPHEGSRFYRLMAFAREQRIPSVASNRVFFIRPEDWDLHVLLTAMRLNTTRSLLPPNAMVSPEAWLRPPHEMTTCFDICPQAIENTVRVRDMCQVDLPLGELKMPPFESPPGKSPFEYLKELAWHGLVKHYRPVTPVVRERLDYELDVIAKLDLATYFLLVWDIVREAHARGILTVGRGSAANSLVCKALDITEVDPLAHNLYFERFLHLERVDFPDIDIDFPWNRRDEMLDYVFAKHGHERVALISSHIHLRGRSTLREVGKALGLSIPAIDALTSRLPHSAELCNLGDIRKTVPECRDLPLEDEPYRSLIEYGRQLEGFPRHLSIHCGGIVVSPRPITDFIPLQATPKGFEVTQYDMYPVEDMGLLKIDLLSQMGLAVEIDTVKAVKAHYGIELDFSKIDPIQDAKTKALIKNGQTIGCFYIESPGMRNLLQKLNVDNFDMLTAVSSIIRPGVSDSGMTRAFIQRHNGKEKVIYLHPKLEEILKETYGVMIYQEDVIKVAHAIAGMSLGEAEGLRKCMSKKRDWEAIDNYKQRFLAGSKANGVTTKIAKEIWRQIESFAGYAFCKAHSASFAVVSYRAAYLKAHFPAEFMAAVLSNKGGFYDTAEYIEEAKRMGLHVLLPHVNESRYEFTTIAIP